MRKLMATAFNYSHDGLLADEGTESWKSHPNRARILHAFSLTEELCACDRAQRRHRQELVELRWRVDAHPHQVVGPRRGDRDLPREVHVPGSVRSP